MPARGFGYCSFDRGFRRSWVDIERFGFDGGRLCFRDDSLGGHGGDGFLLVGVRPNACRDNGHADDARGRCQWADPGGAFEFTTHRGRGATNDSLVDTPGFKTVGAEQGAITDDVDESWHALGQTEHFFSGPGVEYFAQSTGDFETVLDVFP